MAQKRQSRGRRPGLGQVERRPTSRPTRWRLVWPCALCRAEIMAQHAEEVAQAERQGSPPPAPPGRSEHVHRTRWSTDEAEVVARKRELREAEVARPYLGEICHWDVWYGDGARLDAGWLGVPLEEFAQRVLHRTDGAQSTRDDDYRLWHEEPDPDHPKGLGLGERFGHRGVKTLRRDEIREWLRDTEKRAGRKPGSTLSASQVRQRFYLLRRVLQEAMADGALETDLLLGVKPPAPAQGRAVTGLLRAEADHRWIPTEAEIQSVVRSMPDASGLAAALAFGAGLRAGEITALVRHDLVTHGPQRWTVRIVKSESQRAGRPRSATKSGPGSQGVRHLPEWVGDLLEAYLETVVLVPNARLFPSMRGRATSLSQQTINADLTQALKDHNHPRLTLQDLRAAGEAHVAERIGRPAAAEWARHGLGVQMSHYVTTQVETTSKAAAGWEDEPLGGP